MIYVANDVPEILIEIFESRYERYMELLPEIGRNVHSLSDTSAELFPNPRLTNFLRMPYDSQLFDGYPCCYIVSRTVSTALYDKGFDTLLVRGYYEFSGKKTGHSWIGILMKGNEYSIDMTHRQTGSEHMVVISPSEKSLGIRKEYAVNSNDASFSMETNNYISIFKELKKLYDLFCK